MKAFKPMFTIILFGATYVLSLLSGCVTDSLSGNTYSASETRSAQVVKYVQIVSLRPVKIQRKVNESGKVMNGIALGGVAGALIGSNSGNTLVGGATGGLVGAAAGEAVSLAQHNLRGIQITFKDTDKATKILVEEGSIRDFKLGKAQMTVTHDVHGIATQRILPNNLQS